jgi:hypothetical protein
MLSVVNIILVSFSVVRCISGLESFVFIAVSQQPRIQ